jgi:hypothetical protein
LPRRRWGTRNLSEMRLSVTDLRDQISECAPNITGYLNGTLSHYLPSC